MMLKVLSIILPLIFIGTVSADTQSDNKQEEQNTRQEITVPTVPMISVRIDDPYPEVIMRLQKMIVDKGYQFSRVQQIDYGLKKRGYDTLAYRILFFGKIEEIRILSALRPQLLPFLPLKIIVAEAEDHVMLMALNPAKLADFRQFSDLKHVFDIWSVDTMQILSDMKVDG